MLQHITKSIPITIPLILQGCVLPLLLPSGEFSCHLVNLLLNQTASHYHKEEDTQDDGNFTTAMYTSFMHQTPLNLLSWLLPLLLSSGESCFQLFNFLFQQTAPNFDACTRMTHAARVIWQHVPQNFAQLIINTYLLYCRAVFSLSSCRLVMSAAIWSTFPSIILCTPQK